MEEVTCLGVYGTVSDRQDGGTPDGRQAAEWRPSEWIQGSLVMSYQDRVTDGLDVDNERRGIKVDSRFLG